MSGPGPGLVLVVIDSLHTIVRRKHIIGVIHTRYSSFVFSPEIKLLYRVIRTSRGSEQRYNHRKNFPVILELAGVGVLG